MAYDANQTYQPAKPERPVAVTVIAVLVLIYGGVGLIALPINVMQAFGVKQMAGPAAAMLQNPTLALWTKISIPLGALASILWIVTGIGLLQLWWWARKLAIGLIVYGIVLSVVGMALTLPAITQMMGTMSFGPGPQPPPQMMKMVMAFSVGFGALFVLAIGIVFIVLLTRPNVRYAFEPETDPNYAAYQAYYQQQQQYPQPAQAPQYAAPPEQSPLPEAQPPAEGQP